MKSSILIGISLSLLLLALPAVASDYTLGIYGNANEDDAIDMRDLTYVKLIFFGERPETELADAKYDGKINPLDFVQIKLMIVGKEKELTLLQYLGCPPYLTEKTVTVPMPIKRIVTLAGGYGPETLCVLGVQDMIVGVGETAKEGSAQLKPFLEDTPSVGTYGSYDLEKILGLEPDIVHTWSSDYCPDLEEPLKAAGIPLVQMDFYDLEKQSRELRNAGWLLDKKERAEEVINFEQQHFNLIKERVKELKPEEKIRVYWCSYPGIYYDAPTHTVGKGDANHQAIEFCGGINIFDDLEGYVTVDPEEVIIRDPQVIIANTWSGFKTAALGYGITDTSSVEKVRTETIMNYPGFNHIDAVKNGRVYFVSDDTRSIHSSVFCSYMAKYFYPELFEDIDPVEIHREWLETFLGIEYKGVYAYPTPWTEGN